MNRGLAAQTNCSLCYYLLQYSLHNKVQNSKPCWNNHNSAPTLHVSSDTNVCYYSILMLASVGHTDMSDLIGSSRYKW